MIRLATALALFALACDKPQAPANERPVPPSAVKPANQAPPTPARRPSNKMSSDFEWNLSREGQSLRIDYKGKNTTGDRIYVADKLVVKDGPDHFQTTDKVIVIHFDEPGKDPDTVEVILGESGTNRDTAQPMEQPTWRPVEAGAEFAGTVSVPFPLKPWHPLRGTEPIPDSASKVRFRLQYFLGEPKGWGKQPSKTGEIKVPGGNPRREFFEGEAKPIPK